MESGRFVEMREFLEWKNGADAVIIEEKVRRGGGNDETVGKWKNEGSYWKSM